MPTDLSIWTPNGPVVVGDGNAAYDAGNSGIFSASAINTGGWNSGADPFNQTSNYTPVVNIPDQVIGGGSAPLFPANPHGGEQKIGNYSTGTKYANATQLRNQANTNKYPLNDYSADDRFRTDGGMQPNRGVTPDSTTPNTSPSGGGGGRAQSTGPAPIPQVLISQDLTQRPQTGNIYAPDLSAYNDSSLFNYTGPGGLDEYTYGQNLPYQGAGYDIWGSPTDVANPYYEGQYAPLPVTQPTPVGPADGAIGMDPVQLPGNLPPVSVQTPPAEISADVNMPGFVGGGNQIIGGSLPADLTYQQTIDEMGIFGPDNPPPSTTFPSPGDITGDTVAPTLGTPNPHGDWKDFLLPDTVVTDKGLPESFDFVGDTSDDRFRPENYLDAAIANANNSPSPHGGEKDFLPNDVPAIGAEATEPFNFVGDTADDRFRPEDYLNADIANNRPMNFAYHAGGSGSPHLGESPMGFSEAAGSNARVIKEGDKTGYSGLTTDDLGQSLFDYSADDRFRQTPQSIADVNIDARPMNFRDAALHSGEVGTAVKEGKKTGPSGLTSDDLGLFDYSSDSRFRPEGSPDAGDINSTLARDVAAGMGDNLAELIAKGQSLQDRYDAFEEPLLNAIRVNAAEDAFQNQGTQGLPNKGSYAGSSAGLSATKDGPKTGPSGTTAIDANNKNLDKMIEQNNLPWRDRENTSLFSSFNPIDIALRLASGGDVTENAIAAHRANKDGDFGDGLKSYKDENLQKLDGSLYQPVSDATDGYHFRSGKDAGKLSGSQDLTLGGLPMAAGSWLYQQANGLLDGTVGSNANKQSIDNMQGLIASGNAPALKTLFDNYEAGKVRETKLNESIADGTFKPGVKAPAKAAKEAEAAKSAKEKAAKAKAKSEAQAKAKAADIRSKAKAKAKSEAQAKAKAEAVKKEKADTKARILKLEEAKEKAAQAKAKAEAQAKAKAKAEAVAKAKAKKAADEAARNARENARRPTPAPKTKAKPVRTPVKKSPSVTKTSKPSRTPAKKTTSKPNYGYTRTYSRRYGL